MKNVGKYLPQIDVLLKRAEESGFLSQPRRLLKKALIGLLERQRAHILDNTFDPDLDFFSGATFPHALATELERLKKPAYRTVINATGTVIHTNLGRAPLSPEIIRELEPYLCSYSNLEMDISSGRRGSRQEHLRPDYFGTEAILAVNNNAAACMLVLSALARGREVIVSRGELVEIGGSFRIPDIMHHSGAVLREVGTTNKTHLRDYENAVSERTGLILKVHRSNFVQRGFVDEVPSTELAALSARRCVPFFHDIGSGAVPELGNLCNQEPVVHAEVENGTDVISFSGDKLLGGTQAGIIIGRSKYLDLMKKDPLYRVLRPDKFTLYYTERLLYHLSAGESGKIAVLSMLLLQESAIEARARILFQLLENSVPEGCISVEKDQSTPGGGSLPEVYQPTFVLMIRQPGLSDETIKSRLLAGEPPVVIRQKNGACLLDLRTVRDHELSALADALKSALSER